jgi:hypothetical protein
VCLIIASLALLAQGGPGLFGDHQGSLFPSLLLWRNPGPVNIRWENASCPLTAGAGLPTGFVCLPHRRDAYYHPSSLAPFKVRAGAPLNWEKIDSRGEAYFDAMKKLFPDSLGSFPVWSVTDAFLNCGGPFAPSVILTGRKYKTVDVTHGRFISARVFSQKTKATANCVSWKYSPGNTERSAFCEYKAPMLKDICAMKTARPELWLTVDAMGQTMTASLSSIQPPPSPYAMVAMFNDDLYFLSVWLEYYIALGVGTFYLYPNEMDGGRADAQLNEVRRITAKVAAHVVIIDWKYLHKVVSDAEDVTYSQPMAYNNAFLRWSHAHEWMLFYDINEFLVLPGYEGLADFFGSPGVADLGPTLALRSQHALARIDIADIEEIKLADFLSSKVYREKTPQGQEKYAVNVKEAYANSVRFVNIHGIYTHDGASCGKPVCTKLLNAADGVPYHLHLGNRKENYEGLRYSIGNEMEDTAVAASLKRALDAREREEKNRHWLN